MASYVYICMYRIENFRAECFASLTRPLCSELSLNAAIDSVKTIKFFKRNYSGDFEWIGSLRCIYTLGS